MIGLPLAQARRVLCLGAHSDDVEIGCGATILTMAEENPDTEFYWVVFSGGSSRKKEAIASAKSFLQLARKKKVRTEQFKISYFPVEWSRIKDCFEAVRKAFEPDLVFTHYRDDRHQDHRVLSDLAWNTFRNHLVLEYEILKYDGDLGTPNLYMPVSEAAARQKAALLLKHFRTQANKHWFTEDAFLSLMRIRGLECAAPSGFAEAYYGRKVTIRA